MKNKQSKAAEPKTFKCDFKHVLMEANIDEFKEMDLSKELGNEIHRMTSDIGLDDIARKIYHDGEVEIDEVQANIICQYINHQNSSFNIAARQAITKVLTPKK